MYLTRHSSATGPRWAADGRLLPRDFKLGLLLEPPAASLGGLLASLPRGAEATAPLLPPIEADQEVWASGVTYLRSRDAREAESSVGDIYTRVYEAERPELFFKALGERVRGHQMPIRVRADSRWNVPEPELVLVVNRHLEIVGYCAGNDVSSRDIEGDNPLYLPQAKVYEGSCALGPGIALAEPDALRDLPIQLAIERDGRRLFEGETRTRNIRRPLQELTHFLGLELDFPRGVFLMTGTGIVPPDDFSLGAGDRVTIGVGALTLENEVEARRAGGAG